MYTPPMASMMVWTCLLYTSGSVSFMFDKKGVLVIERTPDSDED